MKVGSTQRYRRHTIRRTHAGWSVELPSGAHFETRPSYASAIALIDSLHLVHIHEEWLHLIYNEETTDEDQRQMRDIEL